jgi:hypothetical protein
LFLHYLSFIFSRNSSFIAFAGTLKDLLDVFGVSHDLSPLGWVLTPTYTLLIVKFRGVAVLGANRTLAKILKKNYSF